MFEAMEVFWVFIFSPIWSSLLLEIWSIPPPPPPGVTHHLVTVMIKLYAHCYNYIIVIEFTFKFKQVN